GRAEGAHRAAAPGRDASVLIRPASFDDLPAVRDLLHRSALPVDGLEEQFGEQYVVATSAAGEIVGVLGYERHGADALLRSAAVDPAWRGRGIGARRTSDRVAAARADGLRSIWALTTTAEDYFARLGFAITGRDVVPDAVQASREFAGVCPSTATVLHLPLGGRAVGDQPVREQPVRNQAESHTRDAVPVDADELKSVVRERYGAAARAVSAGSATSPAAEVSCASGSGGCCTPGDAGDPITRDLYAAAEVAGVPADAVLASLGCGNPTALAELNEGEFVLDLGSGGGIDVLLSARRVGPTGRAYGLDMTDDMLALAERNREASGLRNVEFMRGDIENIPLPDSSVDVVISNCVINLAADKSRVLREAFRVLRPGGRFAVSDIVFLRSVPDEVRQSLELWVGCVAGALDRDSFARLLTEAGFTDVDIEPTRIYDPADAQSLLGETMPAGVAIEELRGTIAAAFVRGRKPAG